MKNLILLAFVVLLCAKGNSQDLEGSRIAYSYVFAYYDNTIVDALDKKKLSSREEKLNKKFKDSLSTQLYAGFTSYVSESLTAKGVNVLPMETITAIKPFGIHGYPGVAFPKKTLKKHLDKDLADHFLSINLSVNKPLVNVTGMKPEAVVTIKVFSKTGELIKKHQATTKTENKLSAILFSANNNESFSKIDIDHADFLYSHIEPAFKVTIDGIIAEIFNPSLSEK